MLFRSVIGDHRDLHKETHSFPTRRSSDLSDVVQIFALRQRQAESGFWIDIGRHRTPHCGRLIGSGLGVGFGRGGENHQRRKRAGETLQDTAWVHDDPRYTKRFPGPNLARLMS